MTTGLDLAVLAWLDATRNDALTAVMLGLSWVGGWPMIAVVGLALAALLDRRSRAGWSTTMAMALALLVQLVVVQAVKDFVDRPRPSHVDALAATRDASFPSGHVAATAAIAVVLVLAVRARQRQWLARAIVIAAMCVMAMALSRMYLGVHYPTDVVAGALVGGSIGLVSDLLVRGRVRGPAATRPAGSDG